MTWLSAPAFAALAASMALAISSLRAIRWMESAMPLARAAARRWSHHGVLTKLAFERPVIYRGVMIEPTMAVGKRSSLARAIRKERGKSV
jgi:hypothetical protein